MDWWVFVVGGVAIGILELLAPGYIFLGFAAGAIATGLLVWAGLLAGTLPLSALVFAGLSVLAWVLFRALLGQRKGQVTRIRHDVNE